MLRNQLKINDQVYKGPSQYWIGSVRNPTATTEVNRIEVGGAKNMRMQKLRYRQANNFLVRILDFIIGLFRREPNYAVRRFSKTGKRGRAA